MKKLSSILLVAVTLLAVYERGTAQAPQNNAPRGPAAVSFTADQAQKGRALDDTHGASCHGRTLNNGTARPLIGRDFQSRWNAHSPAALRDYIGRQMPPGQAGALTNDQYTNLVALLLKENGYASGDVPLPADDKTVVGVSRGTEVGTPPVSRVHSQLSPLRMQFPGVRSSSGGPLAVNVKLPPWPKALDPAQHLTPVTDEMLRNPAPGDWLTWRRTQDGLGFSPLTQITAANVSNLRLVWSHTLAPGPNLTTPLVHDGVVFAASTGNNIDALNAKTGELLWTYGPDAEGTVAFRAGMGGRSARNMALYGHTLYFPIGREGFVALDARTGTLVWETSMEAGPYGGGPAAPGGPLVANGKIFQGLGRAGAMAVGFCCGGRGSMKAMDARTGAALWRWFAIPETGEPGGNTWGDIPDDKRSGAGVWTTAYFDYELNFVYFGTANTYDTAWLALPPKTPGVTR